MSALSHRKATANLTLVRADGTPLANSPVTVKQASHQFLFGCGAFDSVALMQAQKKGDEKAIAFLNERMEKWLKLFNYGTLPFYWGRYEPTEGQTMEAPTMAAAKWMKERGATTKGHPLCWHTACADWLMNYSNKEILEKQLKRIDRDVTAFKGTIDMWDVINEVVIMPNFDKYDNAITRICQEMGRIKLVKAVFDEAKAMNPDATLLINDFNTSASYEILIDGLLEAGVPISAIGIQSHQHQGYWGAEKLRDVLNRFSRFGLPIHFTENTLISGDIMPAHIVDLNDFQVDSWPSTPEGEARQAAEISEMYTILFEHPLVQAITTWDFTDDCWLHAPSGFLHVDNTAKPSYHALHKLIHEDWSTNGTFMTDENGHLALEGFKGSFDLTSGNLSAKLELVNDKTETLTLL
ncbi:MAG: endo-1,4-beta-xylanase [Lachnospiraceae bacterium]|nr:endo-1,4-beta-xylanase [Lachnospiraceae bacterium]